MFLMVTQSTTTLAIALQICNKMITESGMYSSIYKLTFVSCVLHLPKELTIKETYFVSILTTPNKENIIKIFWRKRHTLGQFDPGWGIYQPPASTHTKATNRLSFHYIGTPEKTRKRGNKTNPISFTHPLYSQLFPSWLLLTRTCVLLLLLECA